MCLLCYVSFKTIAFILLLLSSISSFSSFLNRVDLSFIKTTTTTSSLSSSLSSSLFGITTDNSNNSAMDCLYATRYGKPKDVLQYRSSSNNHIDNDESNHHERSFISHYKPKDTEVFIRIAYSDINPVDIQKLYGGRDMQGKEIPNIGWLIPGYGGSGIIEQIGTNVPMNTTNNNLSIGCRVVFLRDPNSLLGSYATHIWVDYHLISILPSTISLEHAAAIPVAGCTAYESLYRIGLGPQTNQQNEQRQNQSNNKTLLVIGGSGGVGSWIILLARIWNKSLRIITTSSNNESYEWCSEFLKVNEVIMGHDNLDSNIQSNSISHIICLTEPTSTMLDQISNVIQPYGTICFVVSGESIQSMNLSFLFFKAVTIVMETVFSSIRTNYTNFIPSNEMDTIIQLLDTKQIDQVPLSPQMKQLNNINNWKHILDHNDPLFDLLESRHIQGKHVLKISNDI